MGKSRKKKTESKKQKKQTETKTARKGEDKKIIKENEKTKRKPIILLFGKKAKSKQIHAILENDTAICDSRRNKLEVMGLLVPSLQVCSSCMKTKVYRKFIEQEKKKEKKEEDKSKPWIENKDTKEKPEKQSPSTIDFTENFQETVAKMSKTLEELEGIHLKNFLEKDQIKALVTAQLNYLGEKLEKTLLEYIRRKMQEEKLQFYAVGKGNGIFSIVHRPSKLVIVDGIKEQECDELLEKYLEIKEKWNGEEKPPNEWLSAITTIFEKHKEDSKVSLSNRRKKQKVKLTARRKGRKPKPKIKRRGRK